VRTGCDDCVDWLSVVDVRERSALSVLVLRVRVSGRSVLSVLVLSVLSVERALSGMSGRRVSSVLNVLGEWAGMGCVGGMC
jgi:hypothetical protein